MQQNILDHYRQYGVFTYPGLYEDYLKTLPNDIKELGELLRTNFLHRTTPLVMSGQTPTSSTAT